jgi:hypothetical protein
VTPAHIRVLGALTLSVLAVWMIGSRAQRGQRVNRFSGRALIGLSILALLAVVGGYFFPGPPHDEGAAAHVFQIAVVGAAIAGVLFLRTTNWREGFRAVRPLAVPAAVLALAFGALYYMQHLR